MKVVVAIPARLKSTRLPDKVLARETGKYLIQHTYERACLAKLPEKIVIAADDARIAEAARSFGARCVLTRPDHASGTDRIAEAVAGIDAEIIVNLQGDEPEIDPAAIDLVAQLLIDNPDYPMATLCAPFGGASQIANPNIVKVILAPRRAHWPADGEGQKVETRESKRSMPIPNDRRQEAMDGSFPPEIGRAIYFSRCAIPYDRDAGGMGPPDLYRRHIGMYAYRKGFLLEITGMPQTALEKTEKLEQLRAIENGYGIIAATVGQCADGIDTPEQYAAFVARYVKEKDRGRL